MKRFVTIVFILICFVPYAQSDTCKINLPINYETLANFDFEDELKFQYSLQEFEREKRNPIIVTTQLLCGGWQAEVLSNNWGAIQQFPRPSKRMVFKNDSVSFYRFDTLERAVVYRLSTIPIISFGSHQTLLAFGDSKENWRVSIIKTGGQMSQHRTATKLFLLFAKEYNGAYQCPEELYSQEVPSEANSY